MSNIHLYRQEYIRLLWVHTQQVSSLSAKVTEQRRALKLQQKRRIQSSGMLLGLVKKAFLKFTYISKLRELNQAFELDQAKLISMQQEELRKLKSSWESKYALIGGPLFQAS
ncbi:hypothetical protein [Dyadobacter luticola]|uniref:Uncharacterized protein n=1 Tax=Dyadobacter luticola TaxID=1979387 RepID=A0A5R9L1D8_9BACT|nr:hypothetical protein [Dyadobacter luticola]TLV02187.1 hypothetical protein FEN17_00670 [Dyadobacter luticola]